MKTNKPNNPIAKFIKIMKIKKDVEMDISEVKKKAKQYIAMGKNGKAEGVGEPPVVKAMGRIKQRKKVGGGRKTKKVEIKEGKWDERRER